MASRSDVYSYKRFKDLHDGEICVIICNGPSLRDVDDEFLYKYPTFGTNLITMRENFAPTYYVGVGADHFDTFERSQAVWDLLDHPNLSAVFINRLLIQMYRHPKIWSLMSILFKKFDDNNEFFLAFSTDPLKSVSVYATTTYAEIQLAVYMGFKTVLFVVLDHNYDVDDPEGQHFYTEGTE